MVGRPNARGSCSATWPDSLGRDDRHDDLTLERITGPPKDIAAEQGRRRSEGRAYAPIEATAGVGALKVAECARGGVQSATLRPTGAAEAGWLRRYSTPQHHEVREHLTTARLADSARRAPITSAYKIKPMYVQGSVAGEWRGLRAASPTASQYRREIRGLHQAADTGLASDARPQPPDPDPRDWDDRGRKDKSDSASPRSSTTAPRK